MLHSYAVDLFALTRALVDIESVSGNEAPVGDFVAEHLRRLGYRVECTPVPAADPKYARRFNVFAAPAKLPEPEIVFSTHMDVVPPWFAASEDGENIYGRGACDAKGIIAAQIFAAERLRAMGISVGVLFLAGEERDSAGARAANEQAAKLLKSRPRFLINGEPTGNRLALASKGALRVELVASGKLSHSAYPELGESAIEKLLTALERLRQMPLPKNPEIGDCTMNIGVIEGGRAPNVVADSARAHLLYRLVGPSHELKQKIVELVGNLAEVNFVLEIPFVKLRAPAGMPTMVAAFTTDIPSLSNWGEPLLVGPGSIEVAHTEREFVAKKELTAAVDLYVELARRLVR